MKKLISHINFTQLIKQNQYINPSNNINRCLLKETKPVDDPIGMTSTGVYRKYVEWTNPDFKVFCVLVDIWRHSETLLTKVVWRALDKTPDTSLSIHLMRVFSLFSIMVSLWQSTIFQIFIDMIAVDGIFKCKICM